MAPSVIFFDEIDAIGKKRGSDSSLSDRLLVQFLLEMDRVANVTVIGATNRLDILDPALIRPGRFDRIVPVQLPDHQARCHIFKKHHNIPTIDYNSLATVTEGLSGADIAAICKEASFLALESDMSMSQSILTQAIRSHQAFDL